MNEKTFAKIHLFGTGIVAVSIWALLLWNHYHGGVPSHHILAREDLPSISNAWGALLLPLLAAFLLWRMKSRLVAGPAGKPVIYGFAGGLIFGILLAVFFTLGYSDILGYMMNGVLILALFFPIYRAECLLGFVLGMTYTFGAVLPTGVGTILALIGFVLYKLVRPAIIWVGSSIWGLVSPKKSKEYDEQ